MFCAISGTVPEQPVVSKTGVLFERRLIEKYVAETGKCPVTGEALGNDDLTPLKSGKAVKPRTTPATSIPGLLGLFHDEWDALMLETHSLRQSLHTTRQELSHALYQNDAASRVIARLIKERDEARAELSTARERILSEAAAKRDTEAAPADEAPAAKRPRVPEIPQEVLEDVAAANSALSKGRKKRAISETLATPEAIEGYALRGSYPMHRTTAGGINCLDLQPSNPNVVATAGNDGAVKLFDLAAARELGAIKAHGSKRVTCARFATDDVLLSSSADKTARVWRRDAGGAWAAAATLSEHSGEVVSVSVHPTRKYFVTASADRTWAFYDLESATCLKQVSLPEGGGFSTARFHPDGMILGTGTSDNWVRIWEVRSQANVASFEGHTAPVTSLSFSENGYYLATCSSEAVKLWDLRKLRTFATLTPYEAGQPGCTAVEFDHSGLFLAIGGADARIVGQKQEWGVVKTFSEVPKKGVLSLKFGPDAGSLLVGSADHNLRVFGPAK